MERVVSTERIRLPRRPPRGPLAGLNIILPILAFMGCLFTLAGIGASIVLIGYVPEAPPEIKYLFGPIFLLAGGVMLGSAIYMFFGQRAERKRREQNPSRLWMHDYPWDSRGAYADSWIATKMITAILAGLFLVPFNWIAYAPNSIVAHDGSFGAIAIAIFVGLFDIGLAILIAAALIAVLRRVRHGAARLAFSKCPFVLGETMSLAFSSTRPIVDFEKFSFTLRCVQESTVVVQTIDSTSTNYECDQLYAETLRIGARGLSGDAFGLPLSFELPNVERFSTVLRRSPAFFWELEVRSDGKKPNYEALFLLPVYSATALAPPTRST